MSRLQIEPHNSTTSLPNLAPSPREQTAAKARWCTGCRVSGHDAMAILHVHYAGNWTQRESQRNRSVIKQMNLRHTVPALANTKIQPANAWYRKCVDLDKWREMRGKMVFKIQQGGWYWEQNPEFSSAMHRVLSSGERCRTIKRELGGELQEGHVMASRNVGRALILAVSKYAWEELTNLPNAGNDATELHKALQVHVPAAPPPIWSALNPEP